jgi:hypothetical protein
VADIGRCADAQCPHRSLALLCFALLSCFQRFTVSGSQNSANCQQTAHPIPSQWILFCHLLSSLFFNGHLVPRHGVPRPISVDPRRHSCLCLWIALPSMALPCQLRSVHLQVGFASNAMAIWTFPKRSFQLCDLLQAPLPLSQYASPSRPTVCKSLQKPSNRVWSFEDRCHQQRRVSSP